MNLPVRVKPSEQNRGAWRLKAERPDVEELITRVNRSSKGLRSSEGMYVVIMYDPSALALFTCCPFGTGMRQPRRALQYAEHRRCCLAPNYPTREGSGREGGPGRANPDLLRAPSSIVASSIVVVARR